jgi:[acyl-carrier-protein] S-malonyltransferase
MAARGVTELVEIGAGKVLAGLARRIAPGLSAASVGSPAEAAAVAAAIRG